MTLSPYLFKHRKNVLFLFFTFALILQGCRPPSLPSGGSYSSLAGVAEQVRVTQVAELEINFDADMDKESVLENVSIFPDAQGQWRWTDNRTLAFSPAAELPLEQEYAVVVEGQALQKNGVPLGRSLKKSFLISGPPEVVSRLPEPDSVNVPADQLITVTFDRAMVPLTAVGYKAGQQPVKELIISPPVSGKWEWLSTAAVQFKPTDRFAMATSYTVTVPPGVEDINGGRTAEDYSWSFSTLMPVLETIEPYQGFDQAGPDTEVLLTFNQPVDLESVLALVQLLKLPENTSLPENRLTESKYSTTDEQAQEKDFLSVNADDSIPLEIGAVYAEMKDETGAGYLDRSKIVLMPQNKFPMDTPILVRVQRGIRGLEGSLTSSEGRDIVFKTAGPLRVREVNYNYGELSIELNNEADEETLVQAVTLEPQPEDWDPSEISVNFWNKNRISFYPSLQPAKEYSLRINTNLKDKFGQQLAENYVYNFKTDLLHPRLSIRSKGQFGIFEKDKPPVYYFEEVNLEEINIKLAGLSLADFLRLREGHSQQWNFAPDLNNFNHQSWVLKPEKKANELQEIAFDLAQKSDRELKSGIYVLTAASPQYTDYWDENRPLTEVQYFTLTNLAITLKFSGNRIFVWVTNLQTGEPVKGAKISAYGLPGNTADNCSGPEMVCGRGQAPFISLGETDAEGLLNAEFSLENLTKDEYSLPEFYITAETKDDFAFVGSHWNDGISSWNFGLPGNFQNPLAGDYQLISYLYTDRPVYRAGDKVFFKGIVRLSDRNGKIVLPLNKRALIKITDSQDKELFSRELDISPYGGVSGELQLGSETSLGEYSISLALQPEDDIWMNWGRSSFNVLQYRKPEFQVALESAVEEYFDDETVQAEVSAEYFFGAPMPGAAISWRATSADYYFNRYTDGWYSFSLEESWCWYWDDCEREKGNITEGEAKLDDEGKYSISFPVDISAKGLSQVVSIDATVTDKNNQTVSSRLSVPMHKAGIYVGVKSRNYAVFPGEEAELDIITVDTAGRPAGGQTVTLELFSREWNTIRKRGVDGEYYYENEPEDTFLRKTKIKTDNEGKAVGTLLIEDGGSFRIIASVADQAGRVAKSGTSIYAWSRTYVNWGYSNHDRIEVIADKPDYQAGDTAKLLVKSPYQGEGVKALVTVEREQIESYQIIEVENNTLMVEIPVTEDLIPNAFVSVVIVKPRQGETFDENNLDTGTPAFKIGYVRLSVETAGKNLKTSLTTDKQKYLPGETVQVTIRTTDQRGVPVPAESSLAVVDMSVLSLTGFQLPDLVKSFYEDRPLGVQTSHLLMYILERFKPGSKGGGGGPAGAEKLRSEFEDTAYWNPSVLTDEYGEAKVSFALPDNLTTWKLISLSSSKDNLFGSVAEEILETKQVILRPVRPRFAVNGDSIELGVIVHNFMDKSSLFDVTLTGSGFLLKGDQVKTITIGAEDQQKLVYPVIVADNATSLTINLAAKTNGAGDQVIETIPVYPFGVLQTVATSGFTAETASESLYVPPSDEVVNPAVKTSLSPTVASFMPGGLSYLVQFPYGCAEQTVSGFLPNIAVAALQQFDAFKIVSDKELEEKITTGLQRLYSFQLSDGGFGYWEESNQSYPYLTAYILYALVTADKAGYTVDAKAITNSRNYLNNVLRSQDLENKLSRAERAYILYVLSEVGSTDVNLLNNLAHYSEDLPLFSRAQLAMAYLKADNRSRSESLIKSVLNEAQHTPRGVHFEEEGQRYYRRYMHTNTRTTAEVLQALIRFDPDNVLIPDIVRWLLFVRQNGRWDTTQSTTASLLALTEYLSSNGELEADYTATVYLNDDEISSVAFNDRNILTRENINLDRDILNPAAFNELIFRKAGNGRLYYDIEYSYFIKADELPRQEQGISITREYQPLKAQDGFAVNTVHLVTLTVTTPQERNFVAVESPLPAGAEPIDFSYKTTDQGLEKEINNTWKSGAYYFGHKEFWDDRVFLFADYLPAGVYRYQYLVRLTTPGKFRERPARAWEMYYPEVFGQSEGGWVTVSE